MTVIIRAEGAPERDGWQPNLGEESRRLIFDSGLVPEAARDNLLRDSREILGRCLGPDAQERTRTGLVVGEVQSGKTLSFTAVTALARDNGYAIVVLIAGISLILLRQSRERWNRDLDLQREGFRRWAHFPDATRRDLAEVRAKLQDRLDPDTAPQDRPTVVVTVLKHWKALREVAELFEALDLRQHLALVIDDEADQASLNNRVRQGGESTTYAELTRLRRSLPTHSLLQYTATPQAPLLISIADVLSPDFAYVLPSGEDYISGRDFFGDDPRRIRTIAKADEIAIEAMRPEPPPGLVQALQVFYLGVAAERLKGGRVETRSMLIHPSREVLPQNQFQFWVSALRDGWLRILDLPEGDPDRLDLGREFSGAHAVLMETVELPVLDDLLRSLPRWLRQTRVELVNQAASPEIVWGKYSTWVLIGGQMLDRGFTVEGLTVTYMPREVGVGNADTLQQRARFYGYRRRYFDYCRLYLEAGTQRALELYVDHDTHVRQSLTDVAGRDHPLKEWRRAFFLSRTLSPTRRSVVGPRYLQHGFQDDWFWHCYAPLGEEGIAANLRTVSGFAAARTWSEDPGSELRTPEQRHERTRVPLKEFVEDLLSDYIIAEERDATEFLGLRLQIAEYLTGESAREKEPVWVYRMSKGRADRRATTDGKIDNVFQGSNARTEYPGDRAVRATDDGNEWLTAQVHYVNAEGVPGVVPVLALWIPRRMGREWLVQDA